MREIKFRAWMDDKKYDVISVNTDGTAILKKGGLVVRYIDGKWQSANIILEQYTGFKDFDGKEIYEGDIISIDDDKIGVIEFVYGGWYVNSSYNYSSLSEFEGVNNVVIVGNIHENEELLKELGL